MIIEIRIPSPGESINEVELTNWLVEDGSYVEKDQEIAEVESDKATLPLIAEENGQIKFKVSEGDTIKVGEVACEINTDKKAPEPKREKSEKKVASTKVEVKTPETIISSVKQSEVNDNRKIKVSPLANKLMNENNLNVDDIINGLSRISVKDVKAVLSSDNITTVNKLSEKSRESKKVPISKLRKKLSERLVAVKNETAMLTTFNEVDMSNVIELRKKYQKKFIEKHDIKLGFMSFFTKAVVEGLKVFPKINSFIDGENMITPQFYDVGIAVQTEKGLMVPVIRNAETMSLADIEKNINHLAEKARSNRISIEEMTGGTFTITNGGVFGSLLSTPILNPPQSAILGMHNIVERPVAVNGEVKIKPMMYLALSYDHRIIDGKDSVSFLVKVKELIESPVKILFSGNDPEKILLDL